MNKHHKNAGLFVFATLFALVVAEFLARTVYEPRSNEITDFRLLASRFYQKDDELGWVPRKNVHGQHDRAGSFKSNFSTNASGLRDKEHSLSKAEGTRRIVVLGDSFAWGFGVNDDEIFTEYLESTMSDVEVINLGVSAYGLRQEMAYFKRLGIQFDPDVLVLAFVMNDIYRARDPENAPRQETANVSNGGSNGSPFRTVKHTVSRNSALYELFRDVTNQYKVLVDILVWASLKEPLRGFDGLNNNLLPALRTYPMKLKIAWENTQTLLLELKALCKTLGMRYVIALVPTRQTIDKKAFQHSIAYTAFYEDDFDLDKPFRMLEAFGRKHHIEMINPVAAFREAANSGAELYLRQDMHFNKHGHRLFAAQIRYHLSHTHQVDE